MLFHADKHDLDFELDGRRYVVPVGAEVEIPDRVAYVVEAHGLHLAAGPAPHGGHRIHGKPAQPTRVPLATLQAIVPKSEAAEELADIIGEDPKAEDDDEDATPTVSRIFPDDATDAMDASAEDEESDASIAERTYQQLQAQGVHVPGRRPKKPRGH